MAWLGHHMSLKKMELETESLRQSTEEAKLQRIPQEDMGLWQTKVAEKSKFWGSKINMEKAVEGR